MLHCTVLIVKSAQTREPISPAEGICVTLRYLATGDAQQTVADSYRMSKAIVCKIIKETCDAIWNVLIKEGFSLCSIIFLNKSLPARLKATTRQEASRRDRTDFTKTEKDIG